MGPTPSSFDTFSPFLGQQKGEYVTTPGKSYVVFGQTWSDVSVLGIYVVEQALMKRCDPFFMIKTNLETSKKYINSCFE